MQKPSLKSGSHCSNGSCLSDHCSVLALSTCRVEDRTTDESFSNHSHANRTGAKLSARSRLFRLFPIQKKLTSRFHWLVPLCVWLISACSGSRSRCVNVTPQNRKEWWIRNDCVANEGITALYCTWVRSKQLQSDSSVPPRKRIGAILYDWETSG